MDRPRVAAPLAAYVLHRYDWSESSLILDLFTREQGRLAVIAKGAKRPYSQLRPVLLPFQRVNATLGRPRTVAGGGETLAEVQTLRGAEWAGAAAGLGGAGLFSGFYCNELLMKLLARHDPHARLFDAYAETLPWLGDADDAVVQRAIRAFELVLLKEIGLLPDLSVVTLTREPVADDDRLTLVPEHGVTAPALGDAALPGAVLIRVQAALDHGSPAALRQACGAALVELRTLLRGLLHYHLGTPLLRTRQVLASVQNL